MTKQFDAAHNKIKSSINNQHIAREICAGHLAVCHQLNMIETSLQINRICNRGDLRAAKMCAPPQMRDQIEPLCNSLARRLFLSVALSSPRASNLDD